MDAMARQERPTQPRAYAVAFDRLMATLQQDPPPLIAARLFAALGDLHLRYDAAGWAVAAYEDGAAALGEDLSFVQEEGYTDEPPRVSPSLAVPLAPPEGEDDDALLACRLLLGASFAYLVQGQTRPAASFLAEVRRRAPVGGAALALPLLLADAAAVLAAPQADTEHLRPLIGRLETFDLSVPLVRTRLAVLRALLARSQGVVAGGPILRQAAQATEGDARAEGLVWATWARSVAEGGAELARAAIEKIGAGCAHDEAEAQVALARLELARGRPPAVGALHRAGGRASSRPARRTGSGPRRDARRVRRGARHGGPGRRRSGHGARTLTLRPAAHRPGSAPLADHPPA